MDFKAILSKLDGMEAPPTTPAAPVLPEAVQLNEDAQLRVLSGRTTYVAEAKKKKEEDKKKEEKVDEATKTDKPWTDMSGKKHPGTAVKGDKYTGKEAEKDEKKPKKESVEPQFKSKFMKMVEAKKEESEAEAKKKKEDKKKKMAKIMDEGAKPDFLDLDKDGDKKEPMKKAASDKGGEKKDGAKKGMSAAQEKFFGKKAVKEATKTDKPWTDMSGKKHPGTAVKGDKYQGKEAEAEAKAKKKTVKESVEQKLSFREMMALVVESGGQQQIDPVDSELFAWASRVAKQKLGEGMKAQVYAGMVYERMGGRFDMYDVLSEDQQ